MLGPALPPPQQSHLARSWLLHSQQGSSFSFSSTPWTNLTKAFSRIPILRNWHLKMEKVTSTSHCWFPSSSLPGSRAAVPKLPPSTALPSRARLHNGLAEHFLNSPPCKLQTPLQLGCSIPIQCFLLQLRHTLPVISCIIQKPRLQAPSSPVNSSDHHSSTTRRSSSWSGTSGTEASIPSPGFL